MIIAVMPAPDLDAYPALPGNMPQYPAIKLFFCLLKFQDNLRVKGGRVEY
jgi:hypothetical protein